MATEACDLSVGDQTGHGCRIDNGACSCAFGCKSEFRYANMQECTDALKVCWSTIAEWPLRFRHILIACSSFICRVVRTMCAAWNPVSTMASAFRCPRHRAIDAAAMAPAIGAIDASVSVLSSATMLPLFRTNASSFEIRQTQKDEQKRWAYGPKIENNSKIEQKTRASHSLVFFLY